MFAASFSPEHHKLAESSLDERLRVLKFIVKELHIRDIRLGIRWSQVDQGQGIGLSYYKPYLDYLFAQDMSVCLNLGPIKVMRWPEEHLPKYLLDKYPITPQELITPQSKWGELGLEHLKQLCEALVAQYPQAAQQRLIQLDNEGFNRFGEYKLLVSEDYVIRTMGIAKQYFPHAGILVSSSGRRNFDEVSRLFIRTQKVFENLNLRVGVNYYYKVPVWGQLPIFKRFDNITLALPWDMSVQRLHALCVKHGWDIEVTELQAEPWPPFYSPGNSAAELQQIVQRVKDHLLINNQGVIRLWGIEDWALSLVKGEGSPEHVKIKEWLQAAA